MTDSNADSMEDDDMAVAAGDLGPDAGEILIACFVLERTDEFQAWLRDKGISYRWSGARQWLTRQQRRLTGTPRLTRLIGPGA